MIVHKDGRARAVRTREEVEEALRKEMEQLSPEERETLKLLLKEMGQQADPKAPLPLEGTTLFEKLADKEYVRRPVDIRTFIRDRYYLGEICESLYPKLEDDLLALFDGGYHEAIFTGAIGCLRGDTLIYDPVRGDALPVQERHRLGHSFCVRALSSVGPVVAYAEAPLKYPSAPMLRVVLETGEQLVVTPRHRFWDGVTWVCASEVGERLQGSSSVFLVSSSDSAQQVRVVSVDPCADEPYYDFHVPCYNNYAAGGVWNHNTGKTFSASIGVCRVLYDLSCLRDPQKTFGLAPGHGIAIACFSVSEDLAAKVAFENIALKIKASPYFREHFPFQPLKQELRFPNNILVAARATTDTSALGLNIISALMDEVNFMPTRGGRDPRFGYVDHAETIYNAIKRRMKSRFEKHGKLPGMLFIVSSKNTATDFTARRIAESRNDSTVFVADHALWDVKPEDYYSAKKFWVLVGNEQIPSRIVGTDEEARALKEHLPDGAILLEVPEDFRNDFERDIEGAIRDLGGCATVSVSPFIQRREKIVDAVDKSRAHPFSSLIYDPSKGGSFLWDRMVGRFVERGFEGNIERVRPIAFPTAARHIHIDPSLRNDASGLAMACIGGWKDVRRRSDDGREYMERAPVYFVDFLLRVVPPIGDEIVLGDLRRFVYDLSSRGYMITNVSLDSWQSADALQQLKSRGFNATQVSVDTSTEPYDVLKTALYEGRVNYYDYSPLIEELRQLERDTRKRKIDHPPRGSKDVADALAGCIYTLSQTQVHQPLPILRGSSYVGDLWMDDQRQALFGGNPAAGYNTDLREYASGGVLPVPFLSGRGDLDS